MNILKAFYCRAVQICLRAALPVLPYRKPPLLDGLNRLPALLKEKHLDSVLLITDKGVRNMGLTRSLEDMLARAGIQCPVYEDTVANPTSDNVAEACSLYHQHHCKALIGFGGGSAIDCAKAVGAKIARPKKPLAKMEGVLRVHKKLPPLIAVPTTAGTGSEITLAAVITDSKTHHKYPINDFCLIPHYAVLDPEVTRSLPAGLTASTGMDALTHAVEAYIGRSTSKETRRDATRAVQLIFENLTPAFEDGNNMTARRNMLKAANLAGNAFSKSYVGYVHAVAHSLSGMYNLPHGYANAVLLPHVLKLYGSSIHKKLAALALAAGVAKEGDAPAKAAAAFIAAIEQMNARYGLPTTFSQLKKQDIPALCKTADHEGNPLYPVPVLMDAKELEAIYNTVLEG